MLSDQMLAHHIEWMSFVAPSSRPPSRPSLSACAELSICCFPPRILRDNNPRVKTFGAHIMKTTRDESLPAVLWWIQTQHKIRTKPYPHPHEGRLKLKNKLKNLSLRARASPVRCHDRPPAHHFHTLCRSH